VVPTDPQRKGIPGQKESVGVASVLQLNEVIPDPQIEDGQHEEVPHIKIGFGQQTKDGTSSQLNQDNSGKLIRDGQNKDVLASQIMESLGPQIEDGQSSQVRERDGLHFRCGPGLQDKIGFGAQAKDGPGPQLNQNISGRQIMDGPVLQSKDGSKLQKGDLVSQINNGLGQHKKVNPGSRPKKVNPDAGVKKGAPRPRPKKVTPDAQLKKATGLKAEKVTLGQLSVASAVPPTNEVSEGPQPNIGEVAPSSQPNEITPVPNGGDNEIVPGSKVQVKHGNDVTPSPQPNVVELTPEERELEAKLEEMLSSEDFPEYEARVSGYLTGSERTDPDLAEYVNHCLLNHRDLIDTMKTILILKMKSSFA